MATGNGVHDDAQSRHPGQIRLGITGGIGSGKSYVAQMLQARWDVPVYDCDSEAKRLTAESDDIRTALTQLVGDHLWQQGQMQKPVLAAYLFASPEHAVQVNAIIHPAVRRDFLRWADAHSRSPVVAIESAILCESGFHTLVDSILLVDAPLEVRLQRAMLRDGASRQQVMARRTLRKPGSWHASQSSMTAAVTNRCRHAWRASWHSSRPKPVQCKTTSNKNKNIKESNYVEKDLSHLRQARPLPTGISWQSQSHRRDIGGKAQAHARVLHR